MPHQDFSENKLAFQNLKSKNSPYIKLNWMLYSSEDFFFSGKFHTFFSDRCRIKVDSSVKMAFFQSKSICSLAYWSHFSIWLSESNGLWTGWLYFPPASLRWHLIVCALILTPSLLISCWIIELVILLSFFAIFTIFSSSLAVVLHFCPIFWLLFRSLVFNYAFAQKLTVSTEQPTIFAISL